MGYQSKTSSRDFATLNPGLGEWWDEREELGDRVIRGFLTENVNARTAKQTVMVRALQAHGLLTDTTRRVVRSL